MKASPEKIAKDVVGHNMHLQGNINVQSVDSIRSDLAVQKPKLPNKLQFNINPSVLSNDCK